MERPIYGVVQHRMEVIKVVVYADLPERALRTLGEKARDDLLALPGINHVELKAVRPYEIAIEVSQHTLERFGIGLGDVVAAVRNAFGDYPAGSLKTRHGEILLRTEGQSYTGEDFSRIVIVSHLDGTYLTLADIAEIKDGFSEDPLYARLNGQPAVLLDVYRTGDQNAVTLARQVRQYVDNAQRNMSPGVTIAYWWDFSEEIKNWLDILLRNAFQGGILIFLILFLFLRPSVAVWVFIGIPVSFMGALALMPAFGATINIITIFAFIVVLGIVVDDAIITGENIYTHLRRGEDPTTAAIRGVREVAVPVTLGVLTTIVAFVPLLLIKGQRSMIFTPIAIIVILVLFFSLVESKLVLPSHMRHVRLTSGSGAGPDKPEGRLTRMQRWMADGLEEGIRPLYQSLLIRALERRFLTLSLFVGISLVLLSMVFSGHYGFVFFPRVEGEVAWVTLNMPEGTPAQVTSRYLDRITRTAHELQDRYRDTDSGESAIRHILLLAGQTVQMGPETPEGNTGSHAGQVILQLAPPQERRIPVTNGELLEQWRRGTGPVPGARELYFRSEEQRTSDPIDIQLTGDHFQELTVAAKEVKRRLAEYPGVFDIQDNFHAGKEEIELTLRPEAELLGVSVSDLGTQVQQAFFGAEAQRIQRGRSDVRVMVRYPRHERGSEINLAHMRIRTPTGQEIPFTTVAKVNAGAGFSSIRRVDRHRAVNVTADIDKEETDMNRIMADMVGFLADLQQRHPGLRYSLEGEQREQQESLSSLFIGGVFVLFGIYALLAIPFRSYIQPMIVMAIVPFSTVGALLGHMIMGLELSIVSIMGLLALFGVVVNDSLVLVDYINRQRREGIPVMEAVRVAGVARFRPILLTSLTTFLGLMPLIFDNSVQAQSLIPMAVSLGFGVLYASLLTLFLVPISYLILEDVRSGISWFLGSGVGTR